MPSMILFMQRKAIAEALMHTLREHPDIRLIYEPDYDNAKTAIDRHRAKAVLIEVAESGQYNMDYCSRLCKDLKKQRPKCKLLLMCPEQDASSVKQVVQAKANKRIDDFVFYDVSMDYLTSKLLSI